MDSTLTAVAADGRRTLGSDPIDVKKSTPARRSPYLIPLILLIATRAAGVGFIPFASEDACITFRYARNLAAGNGCVFNPAGRVFGFTSPLWTVWSGLGFKLTHDPVTVAKAWSVLADIVTLRMLTSLGARHASRPAAWCFAFLFDGVVAPWPKRGSGLGLATAAMLPCGSGRSRPSRASPPRRKRPGARTWWCANTPTGRWCGREWSAPGCRVRGAGAPFRHETERAVTFAACEPAFTVRPEAGDLALLVLRRR